jgi:hypothetical protein
MLDIKSASQALKEASAALELQLGTGQTPAPEDQISYLRAINDVVAALSDQVSDATSPERILRIIDDEVRNASGGQGTPLR